MKIKSSIHDYEIEFKNNIDFLNSNYVDGDIIIMDNVIYYNNSDYLKYNVIKVESHELFKEYQNIGNIIDQLINFDFKKSNKIFAIGGGVVQDITGFISSIIFRGVDWYFIPTTLLSQGDSCIGGKTSINLGKNKNQLGNFYPPKKICIDVNFLKTLPKKELLSGLGEMLHYFIFDSYDSFLTYVKLFEDKNYEELIKKSLLIKKSVIEIDEKENGIRKLFNYGHTFGHAIESITDYKIPHGIAVSYGMDISNYISFKKGFLNEKTYLEIKSVLKQIYETSKLEINDYEKYFNILKKDKKNTIGIIKPILITDYGKLFQHEFTYDSDLLDLIKNYFNNE